MKKHEVYMLYVWTDFSPDYTSGLAVAIARDETEARKLVIKANGYNTSLWGTLSVHPLTKPVAFAIPGGG